MCLKINDEDLLKQAVNYVLNLVSKKEYSVLEVKRKLLVRYSQQIASDCINYCISKEYISDKRFAEMFTRFRYHNHYGPIRIIYELKEKGVNESLAENTISSLEYDFEVTLEELIKNKISNVDLKDIKAKNKLIKSLLTRGFEYQKIKKVMSKLVQNDIEEY